MGFHALLIVGMMFLSLGKTVSDPETPPIKIATVLLKKEKPLKETPLETTKPEKGDPKPLKTFQPAQPTQRYASAVSKNINPLPIKPRTPVSANISADSQLQPTTMVSNSLPYRPVSVKQSYRPQQIKFSSIQAAPLSIHKAQRSLPNTKHKARQPIVDELGESLTRVAANVSSYSGRSLSIPSSHSGVIAREVTSALNSALTKANPVPGVLTVERWIPVSTTHPVQVASIPSDFINDKSGESIQASASDKVGHPEGETGSSGQDINAIRKGFSSNVRSRILKAKYYPSLARKRGWEGEPVIEFMLARNGSLLSSTVALTSSYKILDDAAMDAIKNAAPYPKIPDPLKMNSIRFKLPISFILDKL